MLVAPGIVLCVHPGCPSLLHVSAPHNGLVDITSVGDWAGPLLELDVSHNRLTCLQGVSSQLQRLDIAHNRIECLQVVGFYLSINTTNSSVYTHAPIVAGSVCLPPADLAGCAVQPPMPRRRNCQPAAASRAVAGRQQPAPPVGGARRALQCAGTLSAPPAAPPPAGQPGPVVRASTHSVLATDIAAPAGRCGASTPAVGCPAHPAPTARATVASGIEHTGLLDCAAGMQQVLCN